MVARDARDWSRILVFVVHENELLPVLILYWPKQPQKLRRGQLCKPRSVVPHRSLNCIKFVLLHILQFFVYSVLYDESCNECLLILANPEDTTE